MVTSIRPKPCLLQRSLCSWALSCSRKDSAASSASGSGFQPRTKLEQRTVGGALAMRKLTELPHARGRWRSASALASGKLLPSPSSYS